MRIQKAFKIRAALPKDIASLVTLKAEAWRSTYKGILPSEVIEGVLANDQKQFFTNILGDPLLHLWVAEASKKLVGFCIYGPKRPQTFGETPTQLSSIKGQIWALYIAPAFQRQRIGYAFFLKARTELQRLNLLPFVVWSFRDNNPAVYFYRHLGGKIFLQSAAEMYGHKCEGTAFVFER